MHRKVDLNYLLNSESRIEALHKAKILDTPAEKFYDDLTKKICDDLGVAIGLISMIDTDRQFFKSQCGLPKDLAEARQLSMTHALCQNILQQGPMAIDDITQHRLFYNHPVHIEFNVMSYLGEPLFFSGEIIGAVCAIDFKARHWGEEQKAILKNITQEVQAELYFREVEQL